MFKYFTVLSLVLVLVVSCSDNSSKAEVKRIASFNVEGMVCEQGCGASLRKGLYSTEAVDEVDVEYKEERKQNLIHVHYTSGKTTPEAMVKIIEDLNGGQFEAQLLEDKIAPKDKDDKSAESGSSVTDSDNNVNGVEASTNSISLPNLTELLNSLIY